MKPVSVVSLALGATLLGGMPMWLMGAYSPQIVEAFSLQASTYGAVLGVFFLFSALTATPVGRYVNRIDWLAGVTWTAVFSVSGLLFLAFFASGIPLLVLGLFVAAWGNSFSQTSANKGLAQFVPDHLQGRAFGFKQAALPMSTFLVGLSVPIFAGDGNFRWAFVAVAALSALVGGAAFSQLADKRELVRAITMDNLRSRRKGSPPREKLKAPHYLVLLATGSGIATGATMSFAGFLVLFSVSRGFSPELAALVLALGSFAGIAARIGFGFYADRASSGHFRFVQVLMLGGALGFGVLAFTDSLLLLIVGTILGFAMGWAWNGVFHFAVVRSRPSNSAFFTGVIQAAMMAGATVGPPLFGLVSEWSYPAAWLFLAGSMLVSAGLVARGKHAMERAI